MNKLSHGQKLSFKIDIDHVNFSVAESNEKFAYLTASSPIYWIIGLPTNAYSVTEGLRLSSMCLTCYKNVQ
jgi:L-ribulose-5-phosphate 3-epimerase UlaE